MRVNGIKVYKVSPEAATYYRRNVKGNENTSDQDIALKLTRNILLAYKDEKKSLTGKTTYVYGHLKIVCRGYRVIEISNSPDNAIAEWKKNRKKYDALSELLGIKDYKFSSKNKIIKGVL